MSLPTTRQSAREALLCLGCPEALHAETKQPVSIPFRHNWSGPWADREENSIGRGEGNIFIGLEAGKLVDEDVSQMWLLCASCRDLVHSPSFGLLPIVDNSLR